MTHAVIVDKATGTPLFDRVRVASRLVDRTIGLMFAESLGDDQGLLIRRCNSVHTCFMRFEIDVVFLSGAGEVVRVIRRMKPWRFSALYLRASQTLEVPGGALPASVVPGTWLEVRHV